ncbi:MAG: Gfo/Idh/MocA family oxidoreductase [Ktedonobacterales bacterium]
MSSVNGGNQNNPSNPAHGEVSLEQSTPAQPLTWGVLGTGMVASRAIVPALSHAPWARLLAVASHDQQRASALASTHGVPKAYADYQALLDDPEIACVYIALPNNEHRPWVERAAVAGKHILCEKPLGRNVAEIQAMRTICERAGVTLMEALMYRFHPRIARAQGMLLGGSIGEIELVQASFCFQMADPNNYRLRHGAGGGVLLDVGGYCVHAASSFLHAEPLATQVFSRQGRTGVDVTLAATLDFPGGRTAQITCSFITSEYQRLTLVGTHGVLELPRAFTAWKGEDAPILLSRDGGATEIIPCPPADPYALMVEAFTRAITQGAPVPYPLEESLATARIVEAMVHAARTGRREAIA